MKNILRPAAAVAALTMTVCMAACTGDGTVEERSGTMQGIVVGITDSGIWLQPVEGSPELELSDTFNLTVPVQAQLNDMLEVEYSGILTSKDPMQFAEVLEVSQVEDLPQETLDNSLIGTPVDAVDFVGEITEIGEDYFLVQPFGDDVLSKSQQYRVSTEKLVPPEDGHTPVVSDMVQVWFSGSVQETDPAVLEDVSKILVIIKRSSEPDAAGDTPVE